MEESRKKKYSVIAIGLAFMLAGIANEVFWKYKELFANENQGFWLFDYGKNMFFVVLLILIQSIYFHRKFILTIIATSIYVEILMIAEFAANMISMNIRGLVTYQEKIAELQWSIVIITVMTLVLHGFVPKIKLPPVYLWLAEVFTILMIVMNWVLYGGGDRVLALNEGVKNYLVFVLCGGFVLFQIIVVFFVLKIAETHQQKQTTVLIELNNKMLQKSLDETEQTFDLWRQSVHDYKNHVIVLKQLVDENRVDEIKSFLEEEHDLISKQLFMIRTGNSVVDTLVNLKRSLAEKHQIAFMVHGTLPEKLVVENMDLANILGNLLDNAIEASIKEQEGYIDLTIKQEKNFLILNMRNKCTGAYEKEIDKSSKENPEFHGIGLKSVKRAVKKYDGQLNVEQTAQEFIVTIMIQNKQEN
ncbi:MAG: GHKL domain-containing protein [Agathobacter sp.]|nr:GHKL domain-containing protein [Agathobacter sp.]